MRFLFIFLALIVLAEASGHVFRPDGCYKSKSGKYVKVHQYGKSGKYTQYNVDTPYGYHCRLYKCRSSKKGASCRISKKCKVNPGKRVKFFRKKKSWYANPLLGNLVKKVHYKYCEKNYGYMSYNKKSNKDISGCYRYGYGQYNSFRKRDDYGKNKYGYQYDVYMHDKTRCYLKDCKRTKSGMYCYYSKHCKKYAGKKVIFKRDKNRYYISNGPYGKEKHTNQYCCDYLYEHTPKKYYKGNYRFKWQDPKTRNSYKKGYGKGDKKQDKYMYKHDRRRYKKDYDYRVNRYKSSDYKYKQDQYKGKFKYMGNMICEPKKGFKEKDYKYNDGYKNAWHYREPYSKYATDDYTGHKGFYGDDHGADYDDKTGFKDEGHKDLYIDDKGFDKKDFDEEKFFDDGFQEDFGVPFGDDPFLINEFDEDFGDDDFLFDEDFDDFGDVDPFPDFKAESGAAAVSLLLPLLYIFM